MSPTEQLDAMVQCLASTGSARIGNCTLVRNAMCDCVIGTDPLGVEAIVAYSACAKGCREAVLWAMGMNDKLKISPPAARPQPPLPGGAPGLR